GPARGRARRAAFARAARAGIVEVAVALGHRPAVLGRLPVRAGPVDAPVGRIAARRLARIDRPAAARLPALPVAVGLTETTAEASPALTRLAEAALLAALLEETAETALAARPLSALLEKTPQAALGAAFA